MPAYPVDEEDLLDFPAGLLARHTRDVSGVVILSISPHGLLAVVDDRLEVLQLSRDEDFAKETFLKA